MLQIVTIELYLCTGSGRAKMRGASKRVVITVNGGLDIPTSTAVSVQFNSQQKLNTQLLNSDNRPNSIVHNITTILDSHHHNYCPWIIGKSRVCNNQSIQVGRVAARIR